MSALVSITPLADLEEFAEPEDVEYTERLQPVTEVPITVVSESVVKSKFAFLISPESFLASSVVSVVEEELESLSEPSVQDAKIAPADDTIITDKRNARNLLLRLLFPQLFMVSLIFVFLPIQHSSL